MKIIHIYNEKTRKTKNLFIEAAQIAYMMPFGS